MSSKQNKTSTTSLFNTQRDKVSPNKLNQFPAPPLLLQLSASADGAVLLPGLGAGGSGYRLDGGSQRAEEAGNEGEAEPPPGTEHGPAVAVADVVRQAVEIPGVTGQLKVDAGDAGAQGDDAESSCNDRRNTWSQNRTRLPERVHDTKTTIQMFVCVVPPMRKRRPATYCMRPRSQQQPRTPTAQPNRMMATAMPMKPAVIRRRSEKQEGR